MKTNFTFHNALCLLFFTPIASANLDFKNEIDALINKKKYASIEIGVEIRKINTGEIIYSRNAEKLLIPASVSKLFTAYTALKKLKPTYTFKSRIYHSGFLKNGILSGNLYIKGEGDPSLVSERLWMLVNDLVRSGIKKISGNLVGDSSYFDEETTPASRPKYLADQAYNSPISALSFNFNTTTIYIQPGKEVGDTPTVYSDPENAYIDIVNQAKTVKSSANNTLAVTRTKYVEGDIGDTVLIRGNVPINSPEKRVYRNIVNPTLYTLHMLRDFMKVRGIDLSGQIVKGDVPKDAKEILVFESLPLWQLVWGMNKFSNNFVADQLLKKVGADSWSPPGTREKGLLAMEDALSTIGIKKGTYQIQDGSGLTRQTKVTAHQITELISQAYNDLSIGPEFFASLPIASEDGTIRRRFQKLSKGVIRAKTGSLDGVTSLAGVATNGNNDAYAFTILLNDTSNKNISLTELTDEIALTITDLKK